ncbi:hypothetical protein P0082_03080 [Candidatus Haliotispira prima]|uniref:Homoserine dehydrogenase n=1 Tax=Candidatus Haliotispira prima TaxID=3034016 RepID=A0ABY8MIZ5_9SPIO|nr:hypothetical protein P0082_03080 [Candidatus Haliotispira prima]
MNGMFLQELRKLGEQGRRIRIGLVGAGQMGEGLICQCERIGDRRGGLEVSAVFSRRRGSAEAAYESAGVPPEQLQFCRSATEATEVLHRGKRAIVDSLEALCGVEQLDVIVEATGVPEIGARTALLAIENGKHIVQMNVEADATVGYILRQKANQAGVVYTLSGGDEPGSIMELYDFAQTLGFEVVCAGKGKNNRVFRHATAADPRVRAKAERFRMNPTMLASFVDGSKTMAEMCSIGNAIGYTPAQRGMEGHEVTAQNIAEVYCPKECGGVLSRDKIVDYAYGIAPGVFVIIKVEHPKLLLDFQYLALGDGPYYALYRPYHLVSLETPISILRCVLHGQTSLATERPPLNEALAIAKQDIRSGQELGKVGGENYYGSIDTCENAAGLLPLGLAGVARLKKSLSIDSVITYDDVDLDEESCIVQLRLEQDALPGL